MSRVFDFGRQDPAPSTNVAFSLDRPAARAGGSFQRQGFDFGFAAQDKDKELSGHLLEPTKVKDKGEQDSVNLAQAQIRPSLSTSAGVAEFCI